MKPVPPYRVMIGADPSQDRAVNVALSSLRTKAIAAPIAMHRLSMAWVKSQGLYRRPTSHRDHGYWDEISGAPMSTGHAIARFLVPAICGFDGWALFTDGDVLFRHDVAALFALADPSKAVQVVMHDYRPSEATKMTGEAQTVYPRKNWSSVMLWNCGHPANQLVTADLVNTLPGRDLHRFCWLSDDLIGALPKTWNYLVGHYDDDPDPALVHFTEGVPDMPGFEHVDFADEWYRAAKVCGYKLARPAREAVA